MDVIIEQTHFRFKVLDFLGRPEINGQSILSPRFLVTDSNERSGRNIELAIYPKGFNSQYLGFVSIFLKNRSKTDLHLSFELSLEDKDGKQQEIVINKNIMIPQGTMNGCNKYLNIENLKRRANTLLPNGVLTLVLEIIKPGPVSHASCLIHDHQQIYENRDQFSDMKITCNGKEFSCHRVIISSRSPVLRACCESNFREGMAGVINMDSMDPEIVEEMLSYIYIGKVQNLDGNATQLLKAADIYQLDNLKEICSYHLSGKLNEDNCLDLLVLGDSCQAHNLKESAAWFVKEGIKPLMLTAKWQEAKKEYPELILEIVEEALKQKNS